MQEIVILNNLTLQELIDKNIQSKTSRVPVNKPYASAMNISNDEKAEILEAASFIKKREHKAVGNRFAAKDNLNDPTLKETRGIVLAFIEKAQHLHDQDVDEVNRNYELKDDLLKDIDALLHSKKVISAVEDLKKAVLPIIERMESINGEVGLGDNYKKDDYSYLAREVIRMWYRKV